MVKPTKYDLVIDLTVDGAVVSSPSRRRLHLHGDDLSRDLLLMAVGQATVAGRPVSLVAREDDAVVSMWVDAEGRVTGIDAGDGWPA